MRYHTFWTDFESLVTPQQDECSDDNGGVGTKSSRAFQNISFAIDTLRVFVTEKQHEKSVQGVWYLASLTAAGPYVTDRKDTDTTFRNQRPQPAGVTGLTVCPVAAAAPCKENPWRGSHTAVCTSCPCGQVLCDAWLALQYSTCNRQPYGTCTRRARSADRCLFAHKFATRKEICLVTIRCKCK